MFESNDTFVEQVVKSKATAMDKMPRTILLVATILLFLASIVVAPSLFIVAVILGVLTYMFWPVNFEYEYDYTNGSLVIARITNNSKRKVIASVESAEVRLIAAEGTNESLRYDHVQLKTIDASAHVEDMKNFVLVAHDDKKNADYKIVFNPNEKLLNAMKRYNKREIFE